MEKTLSRKRWYRLIPIVFITYSLAYLDRANYGFAAAGGMAEDLDITAAMSSLLGSLFFLGYFFFQIPGALYADKKSAKNLIFWSLILWGFLAAATGMVSNVNLLIVIRFSLGVVESAVMPSMLVFLSKWFTKAERSRANTFLILGNPATILWMSILSGYLVDSVGWRWMFILEGLPAILWAFLMVEIGGGQAQRCQMVDRWRKGRFAGPAGQGAGGHKTREKLRGGIQIQGCDYAVFTICPLVHWRIWFCHVAAFHYQCGSRCQYRINGLAGICSLCTGDNRDAYRFLFL